MLKTTLKITVARQLFIAALTGSVAISGSTATAQLSGISENRESTMHLPAYNPSRSGPVAVLQSILPLGETDNHRVSPQPHLVQSSQSVPPAVRFVPTATQRITSASVSPNQAATITETQDGQGSQEQEVKVHVIVQDATANQDATQIPRRKPANANSEALPVYDGQPRMSSLRGTPPLEGARPAPERPTGMRPPELMWTPDAGRGLAAQANELEKVFETVIVSRMLELMEENLALKAEMKVKEVELRTKLEVAELQNAFARERLEAKDIDLDRRAKELQMRDREMDERHERLAQSERGLDEMHGEAEQRIREAEERLHEAEQRIQVTEEKHASSIEKLRRELEEAMQARVELNHRTRAMTERVEQLERQLAEAREQLELAKSEKPARQADDKNKPANKKSKEKPNKDQSQED